ncbi:MAG: endopeptidase La [Clostridia bacterium]|nr:endopeptidase La [Clostridia bacterium]
MDNNTKPKFEMNVPVLALRGLVVFPDTVIQFDVGRRKSVNAIHQALESNRMILLLCQRNVNDEDPGADGLYEYGTVARIRQIISDTDDGVKIQVNGLYRAQVQNINQLNPYITASITPCSTVDYTPTNKEIAIIRSTVGLFEEFSEHVKSAPSEFIQNIQDKDCGSVADYIASNSNLPYPKKQEILEELKPFKRIELLQNMLLDELAILKVEAEIIRKAQENMDENQREYILREQMRVIANELGDSDSPIEEADELKSAIESRNLPEEAKKKLLKECDKLKKMPYGSHEASVIRMYIDTCLDLPWDSKSDDTINLAKARKILDRDHYGLDKVKEKFIEILAVRKLSDNASGQIICLVGPPGVGKTSIGRSIAEATGRKYARVSLGGIQDEADIMGHRRTYVGSMPGRIMAAVKQAGVSNPLILLDEIDKLGQSFHGDPSSSLLEILDREQNKTFYDHYIDLPFDLSDVLFITTANDASQIPGPLFDRMDVIELGSYTHEEKFHIAREHLIPKQMELNGIRKSQLKVNPKALHKLIDEYTKEAGVRNLERQISTLCRKTAIRIVDNEDFDKLTVTTDNLEELLGPAKYVKTEQNKDDEIGLVNGLAWTSVGGELLPIEVAVMPGTGKIQLTGSLGDVMKESASAALTCVRTMAEQEGIDPEFYSKFDIHIHAPEGAIPKDGPSAGVAMATAVYSALTKKPIRHDVAMTGEITLQGRVLPIGGLKEKSMAAYKNGIKTVLIPNDNVPDLAEVDAVVKENIKFIPMKKVYTAWENAIVN